MPEPYSETDAVIARKLAEIKPPADLRARLLAIEAPAEAREPGWWGVGISAAAAAIIAAFALLSMFGPDAGSVDPATAYFARFLSGPFRLEMTASNLPEVNSWLQSQDRSMQVPRSFDDQTLIGCRKVSWRGHEGALVCFKMEGGGIAHLVMFPTDEMPGPSEPQFAAAGEWDRAIWSSDGITCMLFAPHGRMPEILPVATAQRDRKIASSIRRSRALVFSKSVSGRPRISSPV